jgi:hypothetical protein
LSTATRVPACGSNIPMMHGTTSSHLHDGEAREPKPQYVRARPHAG